MVKYIKTSMSDTTYFYLAQKSTKQYTEYLTQGLGWATFNAPDFFHHVSAFGATGGYTSGEIFERDVKVGLNSAYKCFSFFSSKRKLHRRTLPPAV